MATTTKRFTKGDAVTVIRSWDGKGTYTFEHSTIYSCGKVQMVLTDSEGFRGERVYANDPSIVARGTDAEMVAQGVSRAVKFLEDKTAQYERRIAYEVKTGQETFINGIRESLAALHAPRCINISEAMAELRAAMIKSGRLQA